MKVVSPLAPQSEPANRGIGYMTASGLDLSGISRGFSALAQGAAEYQAKQDKHEEFVTNTAYLDHLTNVNEQANIMKKQMPMNVGNSAEVIGKQLDNLNTQFLSSVPPKLQDQYKESLAKLHGATMDQLGTFQQEHNDKYYAGEITKQSTQGAVKVNQDPSQLQAVRTELYNSVDLSDGSTETKAKQKAIIDQMVEVSAYKATMQKQATFKLDDKSQIDYLVSRGKGDQAADASRYASMQPTFRQRLAVAINAAELATNSRAEIRSGTRSHEEQTVAYQRYQAGLGGLAAAPAGMVKSDGSVASGSRHERGMAADLNDTPALAWLQEIDPKTGQRRAEGFGLEFLKGKNFTNDSGHIQLGGKTVNVDNPQAGPQGGTFEALSRAVYGAETSYGANNAISRTGAAGAMQVMPDTAREIATELGDKNFDPKWSDSQVQDYLRSSDAVGQQYGEHYLKKQLKTYGGDTELALIAYNAGGKRADEFIKSGRDPNVLPRETRDYVDKIFKTMGVPDTIDQNPAFSNVSYEDRIAARRDAESQANKAFNDTQQEAAAQKKSMVSDLYNGIQDGNVGTQQIDTLAHNGTITGEERKTLNDLVTAQSADHNNAAGGWAKMQDGSLWSQQSGDDRAKADAMFKSSGVPDALGKAEPQAFATVRDFVQKARVIPPVVVDTLQAMAIGTNPQKAIMAMQSLSQLESMVPDQFGMAVKDDLAQQVRSFNALRGIVPDATALEYSRTALSEDARVNRKQNEELFSKAMSDTTHPLHQSVDKEYANWKTGVIFGGQPDPQPYGPAATAMETEWKKVLDYNFIRTNGDMTAAMAMTHKLLEAKWGVSDFAGLHTLMANPIEKTMSRLTGVGRFTKINFGLTSG